MVGAFGELHPRVLKALDVKGPLVGFEIVLDAAAAAEAQADQGEAEARRCPTSSRCRATSPSSSTAAVGAADIVKAAQAAERALIADVGVFDLYEGPGVPEGKKSVALAVTLQPREKTLTDAEIEAIAGKIVAEVSKRTGRR